MIWILALALIIFLASLIIWSALAYSSHLEDLAPSSSTEDINLRAEEREGGAPPFDLRLVELDPMPVPLKPEELRIDNVPTQKWEKERALERVDWDRIRAAKRENIPSCLMCNGSGLLKSGVRWGTCPRCAGTGLTEIDARLDSLRRKARLEKEI